MSVWFYEGVSLNKYCKENNVDYRKVVYRINKLKKSEEFKGSGNEEIVRAAVFALKRKSKYAYEGNDLKEYCELNNINYNNVIREIGKLKKKDENKISIKFMH